MEFTSYPNFVNVSRRTGSTDGGGDTHFDRFQTVEFPLSRSVDLTDGTNNNLRTSTGKVTLGISYKVDDPADDITLLDPEKQYRIIIEEVTP